MDINTIHCMRDRAHLAGAEAVILEKEADTIAQSAGEHFNNGHLQTCMALLTQAHKARQRYFRELEAIDILLGDGPSPFAALGQ